MNTKPNTPASRNEAVEFTDEQLIALAEDHGASTISQNMAGEQLIKFRIGELRQFIAALAAPGAAIDAREQEATGASNLVPGQMHCARCKFQLTRTTLYMGNGAVGAGDSKTEACPNGCGPLWPVTWEQAARDAWATCETMFERAKKAEDALEAVGGPRLVATPSEALSPATVAQPVPEGWKLLPEEPDAAMKLASKRYKTRTKIATGPGFYRAMWAAAPAAQPCASQGCGGAVAWNWLRGVVNGLPSIKSGYRHLIALHDVLAWIDEGERRAIASREQEPMGHVGPRTLELSIAELEEWLEHSNGEPMLPSEGESLSLVLHELKLMRAEKSREKFGCATCDGYGVVGGFVGGGYDSEPCPECYPPLPEPVAAMLPNGDRYAYTANQMRGYIDAYRASLSTAKRVEHGATDGGTGE